MEAKSVGLGRTATHMSRGNNVTILDEIIHTMRSEESGEDAIAAGCVIMNRVWGWTEKACTALLHEVLYDSDIEELTSALDTAIEEITDISMPDIDALPSDEERMANLHIVEAEQALNEAEQALESIRHSLPEHSIKRPKDMDFVTLRAMLAIELLLRARFTSNAEQITFQTEDGKAIHHGSHPICQPIDVTREIRFHEKS